MTGLYVASNTAALGSQINLQRNTNTLSEVITRLSTGLRINSGKDDPAGLIASELLKSDITATNKAIQNTQRANSVIGIAESALGQVSVLLNEVRALINEAANKGAMTDEQIAANQMQVDASIDSIDRISRTTNYQGQLLLDGSFDFYVQGIDRNMVDRVQIDSASFGAKQGVEVNIDILADAQAAKLSYAYGYTSTPVVLEIGGNSGKNIFKFDANASVGEMAKAINMLADSSGVVAVVGKDATYGQIMLTSAGLNNDINLKALTAGSAAGNYSVKFTAGNSETTNVVITDPIANNTGVIDFQLQMEPWRAASATIDESMIGINSTRFSLFSNPNASLTINTTQGKLVNTINLIAADPGNTNPDINGPIAVALDKNGVLNIEYHSFKTGGLATTVDDIVAAINSAYPQFSATSILGTTALNSSTDKGKIAGIDLRTNNAIQFAANQAGEAMNNTDVVFINNTELYNIMNGTPGSIAIGSPQRAGVTVGTDGAGNTFSLLATEAGSEYNGTKLAVVAGTGTVPSASGSVGGTITVSLANGVNVEDVTADMINQALSEASYKLAVKTSVASNTAFVTSPADLGTVLGAAVLGDYQGTATPPPASAVGAVYSGVYGTDGTTILDVNAATAQVNAVLGSTKTVTVPQVASTTISLNAGGTSTLTISANNTGSQYNGVTFNFATTTGGTGAVSAAQNGNVITITVDAANFNAVTASTMNDALRAANLGYNVTLTGAASAITAGTTTLTLGTNNGLTGDTTGVNTVIGGTFGLGASEVPASFTLDGANKVMNVQDPVTYVRTSQRAQTVFYDGANYLTFAVNAGGSALNGMDIKLENDSTNYTNGKIAVAFNPTDGLLHIVGDLANASYANFLQAVKDATNGTVTVAVSSSPNSSVLIPTGLEKMSALANALGGGGVNTFQLGDRNTSLNISGTPGNIGVVGGKMGTDFGAIIYNAQNGITTANDVITTINNDSVLSKLISAENFVDSNGSGLIFLAGDAKERVRLFASAMQGGYSGTTSVVTANELIDFINNHEVLSKMFAAQLAIGNTGEGLLTLFQEVAYYGDPLLETGLQFLGPAGSPNIEFRTGGANQNLSIAFINNPVLNAHASLAATNANAAYTLTATQTGVEYEDVAVRYIRMDNTFTPADNYATFEPGDSAAFAYCSINTTKNGTNEEVGNFILTANNKGSNYNDVQVMIQLDATQTDKATAVFDPSSKRMIVTVNDITVKLQDAIAAINSEGTFNAAYDYSYNSTPFSDVGMVDFSQLLTGATQRSPVSIGNTYATGGHKGGVVTVYLAGSDKEITAQAVSDAINNSVATKSFFVASIYPGSTGQGVIDIRKDTLGVVSGNPSEMDYKMITSITKTGCSTDAPYTMVVNLATDANGNSITSASDLVKYFSNLTAEQTKGISVSLWKPAGIDNVSDLFCIEQDGRGILKPTGYYDLCDRWIASPIEFITANTDWVDQQPRGRVVAVNGASASYDVIAMKAGTEYEGVRIQYQALVDNASQPSVSYDVANKIITVNIREGETTAAQVKSMIESSESTKTLFKVDLVDSAGNGVVTLTDNSLSLSGGRIRQGTVGGASLTGATDADPNRLTFMSTGVGSKALVSVRVIEGFFEVKDEYGRVNERATGQDMQALINGLTTTSNGRTLSVNTSTLTMSVTMSEDAKAGDSTQFYIASGGATFQLGPDVVSNQQIRVGIPSVNSTRLGGLSGYLYELKSGERAALGTNPELADKIIQEAILSIAMTRGRLGALQRSTLEPNMAALEDTVQKMSEAEASISNADFAVESSRLTRTQILVQSGASVLGIANQLPQYAAMLIGR
ncbi:MAG: flagellin [Thermoguttaceae bacterium]